MNYRPLGRTEVRVSEICLGTMTWGEQNTEGDAHRQLDVAVDAGVNFIDTAEMYPFPARRETCGDSERFLGTWMQRRQNRERVVVATKIVGPTGGDWMSWIRNGATRFTLAHIQAAVDASLHRLKSDYIDLYQLHWPERTTNYFGKLGYTHAPDEDSAPLDEALEALADVVRAGKVRCVGVSNETPWGTMAFLRASERAGLPRIVSIQNPYNLLSRGFEIGLAEIAHRESVGLLAYSPLGFGVLSGKYLGGARPKGSRLERYPEYQRYLTQPGIAATEAYAVLARQHRLSLAQMALAYVTSRPFVTANIITATTPEQLDEDLASAALTLGDEVIAGIEAIHEQRPNPCP